MVHYYLIPRVEVGQAGSEPHLDGFLSKPIRQIGISRPDKPLCFPRLCKALILSTKEAGRMAHQPCPRQLKADLTKKLEEGPFVVMLVFAVTDFFTRDTES